MRYYKAKAVGGGLNAEGDTIVRYWSIVRSDGVIVSTVANENEAWHIADLLDSVAQHLSGISLFQGAA